MAKRQKLSLQQKRRVAKSKGNKLKQKTEDSVVLQEQLGPALSGVVISRFGEQADVADQTQTVYRVYLRQNLGSCVSGDRVIFRLDEQNHGVIEAIEPRRSELNRPTPYAGVKTIVANVDQIFVVVAPFPAYSSVILDRYLVACELAQIPTSIIFNKHDLIKESEEEYFNQQKTIYNKIGYKVLEVSCKTNKCIDELQSMLKEKESIFVGQSGVGKSSLIKALMPQAEVETGEVSENSKLGTHTTTASRLFFLANDGFIIDSPGVREFGLSHIDTESIINGFVDLKQFVGHCKFRNCQHIQEKGCALHQAVIDGKIEKQRLENYQKIIT
ncbi:small ribosomal subunit biogenesis GTPase RsgA [Pleionea sediminis]|uniref:small ribosomal subunit biogenesis GTPase RsgA n=1 Tax=Pleionea sediminis TaxID=2569479 RepID=UPI001186A17D|nr:small ribosomal subunit biogenesis GTPase RsgA [Pleionea sediminis]